MRAFGFALFKRYRLRQVRTNHREPIDLITSKRIGAEQEFDIHLVVIDSDLFQIPPVDKTFARGALVAG